MSNYTRTTRECSVKELRPELLQAVQKYFQEHKLGYLESEALLCCETTSTKKKINPWMDRLTGEVDTTIYLGMLFTSEWLIWVRSGDQSGTQLTATDLAQASVSVYKSLFTKDMNLDIFGYIQGAKRFMRGTIAMGPEPIVQKFCDEVNKEITRLNPPTKRGWRRWFGGE